MEREKSNAAGKKTKEDKDLKRYVVTVKTGTITNAATDSSVFIKIFGTTGETDKIQLKNAKVLENMFGRGKGDEFTVKAKPVGQIKKISIGHDADGTIKSWFLDNVRIIVDNDKYEFLAQRLLSATEGDKKTYIELYDAFDLKTGRISELKQPENKSEESKISEYEVTVITSEYKTSPIDGKVSIEIQSESINTGEIQLNSSNCIDTQVPLFESGARNTFKFKAPVVPNVKSIHVAYSGSKLWKLDSVQVKVGDSTYIFKANTELNSDNKSLTLKVNKAMKTKGKKNPNYGNSAAKKYENNFKFVELGRLKKTLERESSKIHVPDRKEHKPFVFNDLCPYYDTKQLSHLLHTPQNEMPIGYFNRSTAISIVDPWIGHQMEHAIKSDEYAKINQRKLFPNHSAANLQMKAAAEKRNKYDGFTLTPRFPIITMKKPKTMSGPFYVDDVKDIRDQLKKNLGDESTARITEDQNRTINDFYRMRLDQFHPYSKQHMMRVYHAYLENTAGSKKALHELLKNEEMSEENSTNTSDAKKLDSERKTKSAAVA